MKKNVRREIGVVSLLVIIIAIYILTPYVWTWINTPEDFSWIPIHDQYHLCGDDKFYGTFINESREHLFRFENPVASKSSPVWFTIGTAGSTKVFATLSLLFSSERRGYLFGFLFIALIHVLLIYNIARKLGLTSWQSSAVSITQLLYLKLATPIIGKYGTRHVFQNLFNMSGLSFFESINDHFRLIALQTAIVLPFALLLVLLYIPSRRKMRYYLQIIIFSLLLCWLPYSYISIAGFVGIMLLIYFVLSAAKKDRLQIHFLVISGVLSIILMISMGLLDHINGLLQIDMNKSLQEFTAGRHGKASVTKFIRMVINYYNLGFFACIFCWPKGSRTRRLFYALFFSSLLFSLLRFNPMLESGIKRMFIRGISSIWLLAVLISVTSFLSYLFSKKHWYRSWIYILLTILISIGPLVGTVRMAKKMESSQSYWLKREYWEMYGYLKTLPDNSTILAFTLTDIQLIPIYTNHDLYITNPWVQRGVLDTAQPLSRYVNAWKVFGFDVELLRKWVNDYSHLRKEFRCAPDSKRLSWNKIEGAMTLQNLVMDPYLSHFNGIKIRCADSSNKGSLCDNFISHVFQLINEKPDYQNVLGEVDYAVIPIEQCGDLCRTKIKELGFVTIHKNKRSLLVKNVSR